MDKNGGSSEQTKPFAVSFYWALPVHNVILALSVRRPKGNELK